MLKMPRMNRRLAGALVDAPVAQELSRILAPPHPRRMCRSIRLLFAGPKLVEVHSWRPLSVLDDVSPICQEWAARVGPTSEQAGRELEVANKTSCQS